MDLWINFPGDAERLLVDVTIRHPMAKAYQPAASNEARATAAKADIQKIERYPGAAGWHVTPFAIESWGRLSDSAEALLQTMAAAAAA